MIWITENKSFEIGFYNTWTNDYITNLIWSLFEFWQNILPADYKVCRFLIFLDIFCLHIVV